VIFFGRAPTHVSLSSLHHAVGGGLRYKTVIGTVRLDLGARINRLAIREPDGTPNPDPGQRFAFHISVGESF
jgi:outer membrane translocation and assembly module TamA